MSSSSEIGGASGGGSWIGWKPRNSSFLCTGRLTVLHVMPGGAQALFTDTQKPEWHGHAGQSWSTCRVTGAQQRGESRYTHKKGSQRRCVRLDSCTACLTFSSSAAAASSSGIRR